MNAPRSSPRHTRSGQSLVDFSLVCFLLGLVLFAVVDIGRMALIYTTVANAARAGARYAMVHGSSRTAGSGSSDASGPSTNPPQVVAVVKQFASAGLLTTSRLLITVSYPGASNAPGQIVSVTVIYPYDPLNTYLPLNVRLGSTTQAVIAF